ncbi:MAG: hypothetical protein JEZ14_26765, partial [Marinilabiliaceae bacterium]|nr:hypothetical protein [Marinilabiliaceae bacterium]
GAEIPQDRVIDGKDILPLMKGEEGARSPHKAIYGFKARGGLMSVRYQNWKLVLPGKHWTGEFTSPQLYDLTSDMGETTNVADQHPKVVKEIMKLAKDADQAVKANQPIK